MRFAVIVVSMLMVATPSEASKSCMSKTEARQHFGSVHIYWHGPDHCWDATPTRRRQIQKVQRKNGQPKWQNSMSEMLADGEPAPPPGPRTPSDARQQGNDAAAGAPWVDRWLDIEPSPPPSPLVARWVDIVQVAPPPTGQRKLELSATPPTIIGRETDPMVSPRAVVLVCFVIVLSLATIEVLFRRTIYDRPESATSL